MILPCAVKSENMKVDHKLFGLLKSLIVAVCFICILLTFISSTEASSTEEKSPDESDQTTLAQEPHKSEVDEQDSDCVELDVKDKEKDENEDKNGDGESRSGPLGSEAGNNQTTNQKPVQYVMMSGGKPPIPNPTPQGNFGNNHILDQGNGSPLGGGVPNCGAAPLNPFTAGKSGHQDSAYIINGERQSYGEWPQYIHLETILPNNMVGLCGGTLVSDRLVITAAHCVKDYDNPISPHLFTVVFGEDNMQARDRHEFRVDVSHICISSRYTHNSLRHDWAVITLAKPVRFNNYVQPACLPRINQKIFTYGPRSLCYLVGAGAIGVTKKGDQVQTISSRVVNKLHTENVPCSAWNFIIDRDRVCYTGANNHRGDSCMGDSGGPILCLDQNKRWTLMASVSYGATDCNHETVAVYARTRTLLADMEGQCGIKLL